MTKEQALNLIDQLLQNINVNRQTHMQILEALKILKECVDKSNQQFKLLVKDLTKIHLKDGEEVDERTKRVSLTREAF